MLRRSRVALGAALAALLTLQVSASPIQRAQFIDTFTWLMPDRGFGGFSGLEISSDGQSFTAIGDHAHIVQGQFQRRDGRIAGVVSGPIKRIFDTRGKRLDLERRDSEGLAISADGRIFISFEGGNRVWEYHEKQSVPLPHPKAFDKMQKNSGLEALAIDANGWLYTLPERSGALTRDFPVYRFRDGTWDQPFSIPRTAPFLVVGADFGPDGRLYILERSFTGFSFQSRVRRFDVTDTSISAGETLLESSNGQFDNLEGLSVWRDAQGRIRLTMISDDNFRFFQITQFVEYAVTE
ncbi:esterase-like activity of phytase family protein [Puniceibacterium sediminis]|uniref:Phytase-like domain-containing protein n=1 Tax=Puniceibacterium sediminis TaxID=1608407 RepID=A0A238VTU0_9RHOB|nr:esterase-like activity of phytase family protein [Puniceibacterium sediminis]SNR37735.1 hypothetical protein SAMN06265370_103157 [Puniceibacterium sediminis]